MSERSHSALSVCRFCGTTGERIKQDAHTDICPHAEVVPVGTPLAAQRFRNVVVSTPGRATRRAKWTVGISTDIDQYIQVDADRLRWLIEVAGPKALLALEGRHDG